MGVQFSGFPCGFLLCESLVGIADPGVAVLSQSPVVETLLLRCVHTAASSNVLLLISIGLAAGVAQSVRAFAPHAEGWLFETQPRQTEVGKKGSHSSSAICSATGAHVGATGLRR